MAEIDEQTKTIENLRAENELLKSELDSYKSRLKKVHDIFQGSLEGTTTLIELFLLLMYKVCLSDRD